jgi:DNA-binding transcriptional MerR regulator
MERGPLVYRVGDVVKKTGYSRDYLRRLEAEHVIPSPVRTRGRQRRYSESDVRVITEALLAEESRRR